MDLASVFKRFPDQQACIAHLEAVRWGDKPCCPYCGGLKVARKKENQRVGRWNCFDCYSSFNVLQGTIFQRTKIPLQKWFLGIALMINAKKSLSSCQLARDLDMHQGSCWYMQQRIRTAMAGEEGALLRGIAENLSHRSIREYVQSSSLDRIMKRYVINHRGRRYVDGDVHTNTIEGFWSLLKRAWRGQHHHYSKSYMPLYISEACWKYNQRGRNTSGVFWSFLNSLVFT